MAALREQSDIVIDTSDLNIHQLATPVAELFARGGRGRRSRVTILSFGFKYGLPPDADMVADMRFLPNPFWVPELAPLTGLDEPVRDYVLAPAGGARIHRRLRRRPRPGARRVPAREQAARYDRHRMHGRQAPLRRDRRRARGRLRDSPASPSRVKHRDLGRE